MSVTHDVRVRPFVEEDYPAAVAVANAVWPEYPQTEAEWRFNDENQESHICHQRFVAEETESGKMVGTASYDQWTHMWHPQKFHLGVSVLPEWRERGIGGRLYDTIVEALSVYDPVLLRSQIRADRTLGLRFLGKRGFLEEMRDWESRLDMATFDPSAFADAEARIVEQGIEIRTLSEMQASDSEYAGKLYEMDWAVTLDMPSQDAFTKPEFAHWQKTTLGNPNILPDAWFIAVDTRNENRYVGESTLWRQQGAGDLDVGATGVLREYRRRGIALALKLRACAFAKAYGCPEIRTWNAQSNRAMLSINEALGFVKQPAWISYAKAIKTETES